MPPADKYPHGQSTSTIFGHNRHYPHGYERQRTGVCVKLQRQCPSGRNDRESYDRKHLPGQYQWQLKSCNIRVGCKLIPRTSQDEQHRAHGLLCHVLQPYHRRSHLLSTVNKSNPSPCINIFYT